MDGLLWKGLGKALMRKPWSKLLVRGAAKRAKDAAASVVRKKIRKLEIQIREPQDAAAFFCLFQADTVLSAVSSIKGVRIRGRYTPVTRSFLLGCKFRRIRRLFKAFFRSEVYARAKLNGPGSSFSFPGCTAALKLHPEFLKIEIGPSTSHKCTV